MPEPGFASLPLDPNPTTISAGMTAGSEAMMFTHSRYCGAIITGLATFIGASLASGADATIDTIMYKSPELPAPRIVEVLPKGQIDLWVGILEGPNVETKCAAAQSITLAHTRGIKGLEAAIPKLLEELNRANSDSTTRLAVAQSLIALDAKQAADSFFRLGSSDDAEL